MSLSWLGEFESTYQYSPTSSADQESHSPSLKVFLFVQIIVERSSPVVPGATITEAPPVFVAAVRGCERIGTGTSPRRTTPSRIPICSEPVPYFHSLPLLVQEQRKVSIGFLRLRKSFMILGLDHLQGYSPREDSDDAIRLHRCRNGCRLGSALT
jgi:hypothetical protein